MKIAVFFISLFFSSSLFCALPPLAQSSKEIQELLADSRLYSLLKSSDIIKEVIRTEEGYVILTKDRLLRVDIEYLPQSGPGPRKFEFHFHMPILIAPC